MKMHVVIASALALLVMLVGAYVQGNIIDRWPNHGKQGQKLMDFSSRLDSVPHQFSNWESAEVPFSKDDPVYKASGVSHQFSRVYTKTGTGKSDVTQAVSVYLVAGKGVHVARHTPNRCYVAQGYTQEETPNNLILKSEATSLSSESEFLNAIFYKDEATQTTRLRILWSFNHDGDWISPQNAEGLLAREPAMYKLYLISTNADDTTIDDFAKEFLPLIKPVLFPTAEASQENPPSTTSASQ